MTNLEKMKESLTNLEKIQGNIEKINTKFKEIKGYSEEMTKDCASMDMEECMTCMKCDVDYLYLLYSNVREYLYQLGGYFSSWTYEHETNHVPKLNASAMEKFLKNVGMSDDFEVHKPTIYMSATKNGPVLEVNYKK